MNDNGNTRSTDPDRLASHLHERAGAITIAPSSMRAVMRRGMVRRQRRRASFAAVGVASVVTTTVVTVHQLSKSPTSHVTFTVNPQGDVAPSDGGTTGTGSNQVVATFPYRSSANRVGPSVPTISPIASTLTWNKVIPDSAQALGNASNYFGASLGATGPFYRWSTAPGRTVPRPVLYKSSDGVSWSQVDNATLPSESFASGTVGRGSSLFAMATAALKAPIPKGGAGELVVDVSNDEARTWQHVELPIDLRALRAQDGVAAVSVSSSIAAGPNGVVAVGVVKASPDLTGRLPDGVVNRGYTVTPTGVALLGSDCQETVPTTVAAAAGSPVGTVLANEAPGRASTATAPGTTLPAHDKSVATTPSTILCSGSPAQKSYTWAELGVSAKTAALYVPTVHIFVSPDGRQFTETTAPTGSADPRPDSAIVDYSGGRFVMNMTSGGGYTGGQIGSTSSELFTSTDGRQWISVGASQLLGGSYTDFGPLANGSYAQIGNQWTNLNSAGNDPIALVTVDGASRTTQLNGLLTPADGKSASIGVMSSSVGPTGITVLGSIFTDYFIEHGPSTLTRNGVTAALENTEGDMSFTDASTGAELGHFSYQNGSSNAEANQQTGGVRLLNSDGSVRLELTNSDISSLQSKQAAHIPKYVVLHSDDGLSWSREDLAALAGVDPAAIGGAQVLSTDSSVYVSLTERSTQPSGPSTATTAAVGAGPATTQLIDPNAPIPKTIVLVGTPKG